MITIRSATLVCALLVTACVSPRHQIELQQLVEATIPTCEGTEDCAAKWDAAHAWVVQHAGYEIQTSTDLLIQTFDAVDSSDMALMATVRKESIGAGKYRIVAQLSCRNLFGCATNPGKATLDFNRTVAATEP
jgi:hypothetical protein